MRIASTTPAFTALFAFAVCPAVLFADGKPEAPVAVELQETPTTATLSNGRVALTFDKAKGTLKSLVHGGTELLAPGGGYVQIAYTSRRDAPRVKWEFRVIR